MHSDLLSHDCSLFPVVLFPVIHSFLDGADEEETGPFSRTRCPVYGSSHITSQNLQDVQDFPGKPAGWAPAWSLRDPKLNRMHLESHPSSF